jgi:hypothetical protein
VQVDKDGVETKRLALGLDDTDRSVRYGSGNLGIDGKVGFVALNREPKLKTGSNAFSVDALGMREPCWDNDAAEFSIVDMQSFKQLKRGRIDQFRIRQSMSIEEGWLIVGDIRVGCGLERHAAVVLVGKDYSVHPVWQDASPFETSGRAVRKIGSKFEIIGYAERTIAIEMPGPRGVMPNATPKDGLTRDFGKKRLGNEARVSGEIFSVRLSEIGEEERRDFVGAGFPVVPTGIAVEGDRSAIFGTVGSRPLWLAR